MILKTFFVARLVYTGSREGWLAKELLPKHANITVILICVIDPDAVVSSGSPRSPA